MKSKLHDLPTSRSSFSPSSPRSLRSLIKLLAVLVVLAVSLSALHSVFSPPASLIHGLMIDAGSTGSRIHTYTFRRNPSSQKLDLLYEDFFALKPGLSSFKDDPLKAAQSLNPLLQRAKDKVPEVARKDTPVVLRATAGLRMVGEAAAEQILAEVRKTLADSGFLFKDDGWARILGGNEEAVYSWMTVNYLLERDVGQTVGTLEMGGGSAQVAFVPREGWGSASGAGGNCSGGEKIEYGGQEVELYTTSHLDFGLQKARAVALDKFEEIGKLKGNPCVNKGSVVDVTVPFDEEGRKVAMEGDGDFDACRKLVEDTVIKPALGDKACECDVCTYGGEGQPKAIGEYVAIAFYLERTIALGMKSPVSLAGIKKLGREVCAMNVGEVGKSFAEVPNGVATDLCLDLAYISLHLERGHGIGEDSELMVLDKIKDFELGWCLGAMQQTMTKLGFGR